MKKLLYLSCILIIQGVNLVANDDVYSETNSYNIHQVNSNNTYNDNSKVLSDNSITLFGGWGNDYSEYMNNESILYLSTYVTGSIGGITQGVVGAQLGIYEDVYILGEYGSYSNPGDINDNFDNKPSTGKFTNYGISYHMKPSKDTLFTIEIFKRQMLSEKYTDGENYDDKEIDHSQGFLMLNFIGFPKTHGHTGIEFGMGFGEDAITFKAGLKFRYF